MPRRTAARSRRATRTSPASTCTPASPFPAGDRTRLAHLCRYVLRPPIAQGSLAIALDGRVRLELRRPWRDGTRALLFAPLDFLGRLAALTPRPRVNLLLYHGVLAPHAARRRAAVARAREAVGAAERCPVSRPAKEISLSAEGSSPEQGARRGSGWVRWANLLRRVFALDILRCGHCRGPLRFVAAIDDPVVLRRILGHLRAADVGRAPLPARPPPGIAQGSFDWA